MSSSSIDDFKISKDAPYVVVKGATNMYYCPLTSNYLEGLNPGLAPFCANCKRRFVCATERLNVDEAD